MQWVLGTTLTVVFALTSVPVLLFVAAIVAGAAIVGAALTLRHTGGLSIDGLVIGNVLALAGLAAYLAAAYGWRWTHRAGEPPWWARRPLTTTVIFLVVATAAVVPIAWDRTWLAPVAAALVLDDLYVLTVASLVGGVCVAARVGGAAFRWARATQYRAGLVTGSLIAWLLLAGSSGPGPTLLAGLGALAVHEGRAFAHDPVAVELGAFQTVVGVAEGDSSGARERECLEALQPQLGQVQGYLQTKRRLQPQDAHDVTYGALLKVCASHARKPYEKLGAVLQTAADRDASSLRARWWRSCELGETLSCGPAADELVRFEQESAQIEAAICKEKPRDQQILVKRAIEAKDFKTIAGELQITEKEASNAYTNSRNRLKKRLAEQCPLP
ncbi:MAG: sigma-70 family RNA polymerase sigma factor [Myxococcales bacterium]|nr:sigma-70 family RNA polymerase sigma factor [Myxococcales bacterium]